MSPRYFSIVAAVFWYTAGALGVGIVLLKLLDWLHIWPS